MLNPDLFTPKAFVYIKLLNIEFRFLALSLRVFNLFKSCNFQR